MRFSVLLRSSLHHMCGLPKLHIYRNIPTIFIDLILPQKFTLWCLEICISFKYFIRVEESLTLYRLLILQINSKYQFILSIYFFFRLVYETHYKDVPTTSTNEIIFLCCPGWIQSNNRSHGCNKRKFQVFQETYEGNLQRLSNEQLFCHNKKIY